MDEPPGVDQTSESPRLSEASSAEARILLVERDLEYALLVQHLLREELGEAVAVEHCTSLAEAKGGLLDEVDCVLLDLSLPDATGLEALEAVRLRAPAVPVVVLSGEEHDGVALHAVQQVAQDYLVKRHVDGHLLGRSIRHSVERKRAELELTHQATHDALTGLPNRAVLFERVRLTLARVRRRIRTCAVLFLDLDRFEPVNDELGRHVGDRLLVEVACRLRELVPPSDTVARVGGDEFVVLCDDVDADRDAIVVAERIAGAIAQPFRIDGHQVYVGASVGIAIARDPYAAPGALVRAADETMHRAKQAGSRWQLFDAAIAAAPPLTPEGALMRALEQDELRMYYQPEVNLAAGEIVGVESLMRWQHPERGVLPPGEFIPLAEETGLIVDLGEWAIRESCRQLARWREAGACAPDLTASVNLSARQLSDRTLPETVERILRETGVPPTGLCLELTESTLVSDLDGCAQALGDLRDIGVRIGLDDFGTGYSSLSVLDRYPLDKLKIDRSFVWRLEAGERSRRVFRAVVGLAHALGLSAVAEGVETPEQLADITALGCDTAQGFYLARPQEPARVTPLLAGRLPAAA